MKKNNYLYLIICSFVLFYACSEDTITTDETGTLTGKVVLKGSNEPVVNAKISTNPSSTTEFTNDKGEFILKNIAVGDYSVQARKDSLVAGFEGTTVKANKIVNVIFELTTKSGTYKAPTTPLLIAPKDDSTDVKSTVDFVWNSSKSNNDEKDKVSYSLKIINPQTDEHFLFENITDTTYTVQNLDYNQNYVWQVGASDDLTDPVWSKFFTFKTMDFPSGRILFTRIVNGNGVIFSQDKDGNEHRLTSESVNSFRPRRNDEVKKIAFLRTVNSQTQLFMMNFDGSEVTQVTNAIPVKGTNLETVDFSWADNGNSLVYPNFNKLYKVSTTGGGTQLIFQTSGNFISECDVSHDNSKIVLVTNNAQGYDAKIELISMQGQFLQTVLEGLPGAVGGIDFSADGKRLLYTHDVTGFESPAYRQLDSHMFIYKFSDSTSVDVSSEKIAGTNDLDPRFSPNEAKLIFTNTSNDGVSQKSVFTSSSFNQTDSRTSIAEKASMGDWE